MSVTTLEMRQVETVAFLLREAQLRAVQNGVVGRVGASGAYPALSRFTAG